MGFGVEDCGFTVDVSVKDGSTKKSAMMGMVSASTLPPTRLLTPAVCGLAFRAWGLGQG